MTPREDKPLGRVSPLFSWRTAIARSELPSTTKLVALVLSLFMSELGDGCFPSYSTIAARCSLSRNATIRHVRALTKLGWLEKTKRRRRDGESESNLYRALVPVGYEDYYPSDAGSLGVATHDGPTALTTATDTASRDADASRGDRQKKKREPDPVWDALVEAFGTPAKSEESRYGKVARDVRGNLPEGADYDDVVKAILVRVRALRSAWTPERVVLESVPKHWTFAGQLAKGEVGGEQADDRERGRRWLDSNPCLPEGAEERDVRAILEGFLRDPEAVEETLAEWKRRTEER